MGIDTDVTTQWVSFDSGMDVVWDITHNKKKGHFYGNMSLAHPYVGVRYAACQCARALSRAVSALRTNIVDTGLGLAVFRLFMKEDEDRQVMYAASTVVCNIVTDFSPLRSVRRPCPLLVLGD